MDVVRVAFFIGVRVVSAMRRDPIDGTALKRERAEDRGRVLERLPQLQTAVRQQPVVPEANAPRSGRVVQHHQHDEGAPMERAGDEGAERAEMDDCQAGERRPAWRALLCGFHCFQEVRPACSESWPGVRCGG